MPLFGFDTIRSLHGILRSFSDQGSDVYSSNLKYYGSSYSINNDYPQYAFDFNNTNFWCAHGLQAGDVYLEFCLTQYYVKIEGFEMQTTDLHNLPKEFAFSSSNDNVTYSHMKNYSHSYDKSEVQYFTYRSPPSKCFRLYCIKSIQNKAYFDVQHLEIYGEIHRSLLYFNLNTCHQKHHIMYHLFLFCFFQ